MQRNYFPWKIITKDEWNDPYLLLLANAEIQPKSARQPSHKTVSQEETYESDIDLESDNSTNLKSSPLEPSGLRSLTD